MRCMEYLIEVLLRSDINLTSDELESKTDTIIDIIDDVTNANARSFHILYPSSQQENRRDFTYKIIVRVSTDEIQDATTLFNKINEEVSISLVSVIDRKFEPRAQDGFYWTNEGSTKYLNGGTYVDPYYVFHANGETDYRIIYIPEYIKNMCLRDKEHYEKQGATYMWECTACWDNFMSATTLEEAIEEFEQMYCDRLWKTVEHYKNMISESIDKYYDFNQYRHRKETTTNDDRTNPIR